MALETAISNPAVLVNGQPIAIVANSLETNSGDGEQIVRPTSVGGGSIVLVVTKNVETQKSMVNFKLTSTATNLRLIQDIKRDRTAGGTDIQIADENFQGAFPEMILLADPTIPMTQDGEIELQFEGPPTTPGGIF